MILLLTLLMLIPGAMIQSVIRERQERSMEAMYEIDEKYRSQIVAGPVIELPYTITYKNNENVLTTNNTSITLTPETLDIQAEVLPEEKHYGIFKAIVYKSRIEMSGTFNRQTIQDIAPGKADLSHAYIKMGVSDLKGVADNLIFTINGERFEAEAEGLSNYEFGRMLTANIGQMMSGDEDILHFSCTLDLCGSRDLSFVPMGQTTSVVLSGAWPHPSFTGSFSPDSQVDNDRFTAKWNILRFNRAIPTAWIGDQIDSFDNFGVSLIEPVDHYQQVMRSAKYASMFIILTFVIFFFVEILTGKRIHPIQYMLVGLALMIFYILLLSISEHTGFMCAYAIAAAAVICMIALYVGTIFRNRRHTALLSGFIALLYVYLYVILQLRDAALLAGSIGLFVILAAVMYFSRKVNWYKEDATE